MSQQSISEVDLPFVVRKLAKRSKNPLQGINFGDMILYSGWKPICFLISSQGTFRQVSSKEKMVYTELSKLILERDREYAEETRDRRHHDSESSYNTWRIVYKDGTTEFIPTSRLLYNFSKGKVGKLYKEVFYLVREPTKRVINAERSRRVKVDTKEVGTRWPELWSRAELYGRKLNEELPAASSKYISESEEQVFLSGLSEELLCRYQAMRLHWAIRCVHGKVMQIFDCLWDFDEWNQLWIMGLRIYVLDEDKNPGNPS